MSDRDSYCCVQTRYITSKAKQKKKKKMYKPSTRACNKTYIIVTSTSARRASCKKYLGLCPGKSGFFFCEQSLSLSFCLRPDVYIYIHIHIGGNRGRLTPQDFLLLNVTTSDSPLRLTMGMDSEGRPKGIHYNKGTFALPCVTREPGCVNRQFDADRAGGWISTKMKTDVV